VFEFCGACVQVKPDLVVELALESNAAAGVSEAIEPFGEDWHLLPCPD
jgi:hypothetical protein